MITYELKIENQDGYRKTVYVSERTYTKAVNAMKAMYGKCWTVYDSKMIRADNLT